MNSAATCRTRHRGNSLLQVQAIANGEPDPGAGVRTEKRLRLLGRDNRPGPGDAGYG